MTSTLANFITNLLEEAALNYLSMITAILIIHTPRPTLQEHNCHNATEIDPWLVTLVILAKWLNRLSLILNF